MRINKFRNIIYKISSWFKYESPIYIEFNIFRLWRYYWKARKYFKSPDIVFHKLNINDSLGSDYFCLPVETHNKIFHMSIEACDWKSKFGEIRFEAVPYICIIISNKIKYVIGLEAPLWKFRQEKWTRDNLLYWEAVLGYSLRYKKDLVRTYKNNIWSDLNGNQSTIFEALTSKGKKIIVNSCLE